MGYYLFSLLFGGVFLFAHQGCTGSGSCPCTAQQDSCTCHLTEADTTLTVEAVTRYIQYPLADTTKLYVTIRNNTKYYYNIPEYFDIHFEKFENGSWQKLLPLPSSFLHELVPIHTGVAGGEKKMDSYPISAKRYFHSPGRYRIVMPMERMRFRTEYNWLHPERTNDTIIRMAEFELVDADLSAVEEMNRRVEQKRCRCERWENDSCQLFAHTDSVMLLKVQEKVRMPLQKKSLELTFVNHTGKSFRFPYTLKIERHEKGQWVLVEERRFTNLDYYKYNLRAGQTDHLSLLSWESSWERYKKGRYRVLINVQETKPDTRTRFDNEAIYEETGNFSEISAEFEIDE